MQLVFTPADGAEKTVMDVYDFKGKGVAMSMYNTDEVLVSWRFVSIVTDVYLAFHFQSITGFAHSSFKMALSKKMPLVRQQFSLT